MPLTRPALALGPGPRGVQAARQWVVRTCRDIGRDDLVECAELGVSELVTNALLHGAPPIRIRVRGTVEHPRIEVRDGSPDQLVLPTAVDGADGLRGDHDLLLTFGRGLTIVARASDAWGAEKEEDGKTVWFTPAATFAEGEGVAGVMTGWDEGGRTTSAGDLIELGISDVPLREYVAFQHHYRELRREVRLLALAHERDYPLAKELSDLFGSLEQPLRQGLGIGMGADRIETALSEGRERIDVRLVMERAAARDIDRFIELLERADTFCREQRLLSLARGAEQQQFQRWFLGELVRQSRDPTAAPADESADQDRRSTGVS